jgi:uncharacterized protein (TIGR02452 family)
MFHRVSDERDHRREALKHIARTTIKAIRNGGYRIKGVEYYLHVNETKLNTIYYAPESSVSKWRSFSIPQSVKSSFAPTYISILEISTLDCARQLSIVIANNPHDKGRVGILNFASATKPGGGFATGAQAQEESIARSSTLYPSLMTYEGREFYHRHKLQSTGCFYTHAMIWSPGVRIFRDDDGGWLPPVEVDIITSAAVNAGEARERMYRRLGRRRTEECIENEMKERMARILYLFEKKGTRNLVLGSFGTGVFRNDIDVVARLWAELFSSRFKTSFDRVVFAILGGKTFSEFEFVFNACSQDDKQPAELLQLPEPSVGLVPSRALPVAYSPLLSDRTAEEYMHGRQRGGGCSFFL